MSRSILLFLVLVATLLAGSCGEQEMAKLVGETPAFETIEKAF